MTLPQSGLLAFENNEVKYRAPVAGATVCADEARKGRR